MFRYASGLCGGATHDALANAVSGFMEEVEWGLLKVVFWVAGDEAYKISEWIITPFPSSTLTQDEDNFNFVLSSLRIHIEQAFGMLVARWRIIRNGLNFSVKRCSRIISTVMKLHNFCVLEDNFGKKGSPCAWDGLYESLNVHERDELRSDQGNVVREMTRVHRENLERSRRGVEEPNTRTRGANCIPSHKREVLKSMVKTKGYVRPSAS